MRRRSRFHHFDFFDLNLRRVVLLAAIAAAALAACADDEPPRDPRIGENGLLRFVGGGCDGSMTMAVGSRETLVLEGVNGPLPAGEFSAQAGAPDVIDVAMGDAPDEIDLAAHAPGQSRIAIALDGRHYDAITFAAEPATAVRYQSVDRVFAGGTAALAVTAVFGGCGTDDCRLFGHSFLQWSSEPADGLTLLFDDGGAASFQAASEPGWVRLVGHEPAAGAQLVDHSLEIVDPSAAQDIEATLTTIPLDENSVAQTMLLPGQVRASTVFTVSLRAGAGSEPAVRISRHDVLWRSLDENLVVALPMDHPSEPWAKLFVAGSSPGTVELEATIELLGRTQRYEVVITP